MHSSNFKKIMIILLLLMVIMSIISWTRHLAFVPMIVAILVLLLKIRSDRRDL